MSAPPLIFSADVKDDGYLMGDVGEGKAQVYSDEVSSTAPLFAISGSIAR
jgi:hypothetical protein